MFIHWMWKLLEIRKKWDEAYLNQNRGNSINGAKKDKMKRDALAQLQLFEKWQNNWEKIRSLNFDS